MINELYDALTGAIRSVGIGLDPARPGVGIIRHIDLWNQNVVFIDEDEPWERPAVFIEFGPIIWDPYKGVTNGMVGKGELRLHVVTDWKGSAAAGSPAREETMEDFRLSNLIMGKVRYLRGDTFRNLVPLRTEINHNHQEILENIDVYQVTYERVL